MYRGDSVRWHAWSDFYCLVLNGFHWFAIPLGSLIMGWSWFCSLGLSRGLISLFGVRNWKFFSILQPLVCGFGGCLWGNGIGSSLSFMGGH